MVIRVEHLVKKYKDLTAVNDISFKVKRKEVFAFLGPNGAGKTTTVEILECLRNPTSGLAEVLGYDVSDKKGQEEIKDRILLVKVLSILRRSRSEDPPKLTYLEARTTSYEEISGWISRGIASGGCDRSASIWIKKSDGRFFFAHLNASI